MGGNLFFWQLEALLVKNLILAKRNWFIKLLEFIIPLAFTLFIWWIRSRISYGYNEGQSNYSLYGQAIPSGGYDEALSNLTLFQQTQFYSAVGSEASLFYAGLQYWFKNCSKFQDETSGGFVAMIPRNSITEQLEALLIETVHLDQDIVYFNTEDEMKDFVLDPLYGNDGDADRICMAIQFDKTESGSWDYLIRYNLTGEPDNVDLPETTYPRTIDFEYEWIEGTYAKYVLRGYLMIQNWIDNIILREETGNKNARIYPIVAPFPLHYHYEDDIYDTINGLLGFFVVLPMLMPYLRLTYAILVEKEKKIKENMRNMGLSLTPYYLAWIIFYTAQMILLSLLWSLLGMLFFTKSKFIMIFLWYFTFSMIMMGMALFITAFYSHAKSGVLTSLILFFVFFIINIIIPNFDDMSAGTKAFLTLSPTTGVDMAASSILYFESLGRGMDYSNIYENGNNYYIFIYFIIGWCQVLFFSLLGIYFDQVAPLDFGRRKHPLFCCMKRRPKNEIKRSQSMQRPEEVLKDKYQEVDNALKAQEKENKTLEISRLKYVYPSGKHAVEGVDVNMYSGQIFALLGHNGAGKTTTISMISGLLTQTEGAIKILGLDTIENPEEIKRIIGVCPQTNPVFDSLTVMDHLNLYGRIKGLSPKMIKSEAEELLANLDFPEKRNAKAKNLSGGQKRKLCVACAFIGKSKVILFDEPTSGMDTYARRKLWEMLKNYKNDRIIILTTHSMDEADFLGDRIGIMGEGKLICCGNSLFLKSKYGVGYTLTVMKKDTMQSSQDIISLVLSSIPSSTLLSDVSAEITFQLPMESTSSFNEAFGKLDSAKDRLGIDNYGVSVTTLEEVFLKVAGGVAENRTDFQAKADLKNEQKEIREEEEGEIDLESIRVKNPCTLFFMHFKALMLKRLIYFSRDIKGLICEVFIPIIIVVIGLMLMLIQFVTEGPWISMEVSNYEEPISVIYNQKLINGDAVPSVLLDTYHDSGIDFTGLDFSSLQDLDDYLVENTMPSEDRPYSIYFLDVDQANDFYAYFLFVNTTALESTTFGMAMTNKALIRYSLQDASFSINSTCAPLPQTQSTLSIENTADAFLAAIMFSLGVSFIPASLIVYIIKERETNVKHQQIVSGVSLTAYWSANFTADIIKYIPVGLSCWIFTLIFDIEAFVEGDNLGMTLLLFIFYGICMISFVYCLSFVFTSPTSGQIFTFLLFFIVGCIGSVAIFILYVIESTKKHAEWLRWVFRLLPSFSFSYGLVNISNKTIYQIIEEWEEEKGAFTIEIALGDLIYLVVLSLAYFLLIFVIEFFNSIPSISRLATNETHVKKHNADLTNKDEDVKQEEEEVAKSNNYVVKVNHARKVYGGFFGGRKVAVDDISFGVKNGDCFALLGINGAGKTSTFKMLSGEIPPTSGSIKIADYKIPEQMSKVRHKIGYCPQFDALLDNLTGRQHLNMYAAIKGIPSKLAKKLVDKIIVEMDLKRFEHVKAGTYSGGNKRKLSVAMAIIGNPPLVFLDEPSSGMDPEARRFMWDIISRISTKRRKSAVILTTHSMEEAEALSTRLVIMVDGNFKCIGSVQQIKSKFGKVRNPVAFNLSPIS